MPSYIIRAESVRTYETHIDADSLEDAMRKGKELDGSTFYMVEELVWNVYDAYSDEEITNA